mgnify:FL=1
MSRSPTRERPADVQILTLENLDVLASPSQALESSLTTSAERFFDAMWVRLGISPEVVPARPIRIHPHQLQHIRWLAIDDAALMDSSHQDKSHPQLEPIRSWVAGVHTSIDCQHVMRCHRKIERGSCGSAGNARAPLCLVIDDRPGCAATILNALYSD